MEPIRRVPQAIWNSQRDVWEVMGVEATTCLFCGHSDVFSETFTTSGMTLNGVAYGLPTWEPPTAGSVCSSSPDDDELLGTPRAAEWKGCGPVGSRSYKHRLERGYLDAQALEIADLLPTPQASLGDHGRANGTDPNRRSQPSTADVVCFLPTPEARNGSARQDYARASRPGSGGDDLVTTVHRRLLPTTTAADAEASGASASPSNVTLTDAMVRGKGLLPTPSAANTNDGEDPEAWEARRQKVKAKGINGNGMGKPLAIAAQELMPTPRATRGGSGTETMYALGAERSDEDRPQGEVLMPTPRATDGTKGGPNQRGSSGDLMLPSAVQTVTTNWGPYEGAVRRWEAVLGRPAPAPTEPNTKGGQRLSPRFTEWMMGVPEGWITDVDISRNEQLKACGNGVVPQQAEAALRDMLEAFGPQSSV